jgi:hypothetical protein
VGAGALDCIGKVITVDGGGLVYAGALALTAPDERADPDLARLAGWARARSVIAVVSPADAPAGLQTVEVSAQQALEPAALSAALQGSTAARGAALATPEIARAAARAGVTTLVTHPVLPALLAVVRRSEPA